MPTFYNPIRNPDIKNISDSPKADQMLFRRALAVFRAIQNDQPGVVADLLRAGTDPNVPSVGICPLHYACYLGRIDCACVLIDRGADPDAVCVQGWSPAHHAVFGMRAKRAFPDITQDIDAPGLTECLRLLLALRNSRCEL